MPVRSATTAASPICRVLATRMAQILDGLAFVENGLAVHADEVDGVERDAFAAAGFVDGFGVELA